MFGTIFSVAVMVLVMGLSFGLLQLPYFDINANIVHISKDLQAIEIQPIDFLGPVGYLAIPFNTVCNISAVDYLFCFLCNQDCIYVHNTYGGRCGRNPLKPEQTICLCARTQEDATQRQISPSSSKTCTSYIGCTPLPPFIGHVADDAFRLVLEERQDIAECVKRTDESYEESGCISDCQANHGAKSGKCVETVPLVSEVGTTKTIHCECSY